MKISFVMTIYKSQLFKSLKITDWSKKKMNVAVSLHGSTLPGGLRRAMARHWCQMRGRQVLD